jgi:hypothetical protein
MVNREELREKTSSALQRLRHNTKLAGRRRLQRTKTDEDEARVFGTRVVRRKARNGLKLVYPRSERVRRKARNELILVYLCLLSVQTTLTLPFHSRYKPVLFDPLSVLPVLRVCPSVPSVCYSNSFLMYL